MASPESRANPSICHRLRAELLPTSSPGATALLSVSTSCTFGFVGSTTWLSLAVSASLS
jgi:hypothetical protein